MSTSSKAFTRPVSLPQLSEQTTPNLLQLISESRFKSVKKLVKRTRERVLKEERERALAPVLIEKSAGAKPSSTTKQAESGPVNASNLPKNTASSALTSENLFVAPSDASAQINSQDGSASSSTTNSTVRVKVINFKSGVSKIVVLPRVTGSVGQDILSIGGVASKIGFKIDKKFEKNNKLELLKGYQPGAAQLQGVWVYVKSSDSNLSGKKASKSDAGTYTPLPFGSNFEGEGAFRDLPDDSTIYVGERKLFESEQKSESFDP